MTGGVGYGHCQVQGFNIEHILECGQCFRYHRLDDKDYLLVASGKLLRVKQAPEIDFYCERMEYDESGESI